MTYAVKRSVDNGEVKGIRHDEMDQDHISSSSSDQSCETYGDLSVMSTVNEWFGHTASEMNNLDKSFLERDLDSTSNGLEEHFERTTCTAAASSNCQSIRLAAICLGCRNEIMQN